MSFAINHLIGFGGRRATSSAEQTATWNPSDKDADITLSNGDRDTAGAGAGSVRCVLGRSSGKYYWEVTIITGSPGNLFIGMANGTFSLSTYPGAGASSAGIASYGNSVNTWTKAQTGTFPLALNDVVMFAADVTTGYLWVGLNGTWQLSGDPDAGTTPWVTGISGTVYPTIGYVGAYSTGGRISTKTAELTYSPPTGFSQWAAP